MIPITEHVEMPDKLDSHHRTCRNAGQTLIPITEHVEMPDKLCFPSQNMSKCRTNFDSHHRTCRNARQTLDTTAAKYLPLHRSIIGHHAQHILQNRIAWPSQKFVFCDQTRNIFFQVICELSHKSSRYSFCHQRIS